MLGFLVEFVIYLPKMPACPHAFPPAHPHETHHVCVFFLRDIYFGFIFILVFFYLLIYFYLFFESLHFFCLFSVLFLLIEYLKGGVPIRQFIHASGLLTSIY